MIFKTILSTLTTVAVNAQGGANWDFNYVLRGKDWPELKPLTGTEVNNCGAKNQSPINLMKPIGSYGWAYGETVPKSHDNIALTFKDLKKLSKIEWKQHSVGMDFHESDAEDNFFVSGLATEYFDTPSNQFQNSRFKFRSQSEHTIDGKHTDLEMQIFFDAKDVNTTSSVNAAAVAILFDVENSEESISPEQATSVDDFLNDLKFDVKEDTIDIDDKIRYATFMNNIVDFKERWIYQGSYTEPPCKGGVYWNVIRTIYPITLDRLEQIKEKMALLSASADPNNYVYNQNDFQENAEGARTRSSTLNFYRKLQKIDEQNVKYTAAKYLANVTALMTALTSVFAIWASA